MASFKKVETTVVDAKYEGRIKVFLESAEDVRIFSGHWFSHKQDKLHFVSAEGEQSGGGGCMAVIDKVSDSNSQKIEAYGIVDRDVLLSNANLDLFWETDDTKFHDAQPYGDKIHVLRRWELENYLLQPEAFAHEVSRRISRSPAPDISAETFLADVDDIIQVTALTTYSVANGQKSPNPAFGTNIPPGSDLSQEIDKFLKKQFPAPACPDISKDAEKIRSFDQSTANPAARWERLTRILDGKKSLMRLCRYISTSLNLNSIDHWEEMRGCLANIIASKGQIDKELVKLIEEISSSSLA
ncbi:hypothetical protein [Methylomonas methanica]|uniref:DUF4435 domain-containing protein n=1 Tax=Methylomonas methanica (strain DSM 25384 / MC09) TaxID=857087 RepID=F9ZYV9_METMM|nr:hypothetical protein [Methylomonas methanica]AEF98655.1 hypothetical protein Metme_0206 [Methylomonas methanica MC09]